MLCSRRLSAIGQEMAANSECRWLSPSASHGTCAVSGGFKVSSIGAEVFGNTERCCGHINRSAGFKDDYER